MYMGGYRLDLDRVDAAGCCTLQNFSDLPRRSAEGAVKMTELRLPRWAHGARKKTAYSPPPKFDIIFEDPPRLRWKLTQRIKIWLWF